jgi:predicted nuclease with TOPRIM domain
MNDDDRMPYSNSQEFSNDFIKNVMKENQELKRELKRMHESHEALKRRFEIMEKEYSNVKEWAKWNGHNLDIIKN